tara:strand:- start:222 stop:1058 length:837 start_codon:yes stop_codon:yes gene_type:complete
VNILTDILSLLKRKKVTDDPKPNDVVVIGVHEPPEMTGVASPIPYKSVKLVKLKDLVVDQDICPHVNVINDGTLTAAGVFKEVSDDPCQVRFRSLVASGNNLTISENVNEITFTTDGEPNTASNVGGATGIFKQKTGENLEFKSLTSPTGTVSITGSTSTVDLEVDRNEIAEIYPVTITGTAGGSQTYTDVSNFVYLKYDLSSGNGTYTITLPSAASSTNRTIRFFTNGALNANHTVDLVGNGGDTIDGGSNFLINRNYEGVMMWSDGIEWIIIQAKG